jgi:uncharacterized protein YlxW (UPF0749 family)
VEHVERQDEREAELREDADRLEEKGDELEQQGGKLDDEIDDVRQEFERKKGSTDAPGAQDESTIEETTGTSPNDEAADDDS